MNTEDFFILLIKLPNSKIIKTSKLKALNSTIETLKIEAAVITNINFNRFELI
jgi:hypothetical protein